MPTRRRPTILAALAAALFLTALPVAAAEGEFKTVPVGEKAPLFTTVTVDGQPFDLGEAVREKGIVLFFWSLFCSPCREEMPLLDKISKDLAGKPVEFIGVNLDEPPLHNAVRGFLKSAGLGYRMVVTKTPQADSQSDKLYLITGTPVLYLISPGGTIAYGHVGRLEEAELRKLIEEKLL